MAHTMTKDEYRRFLMKGTRTAQVATAGVDGRPHVAPVWFVLDGDAVLFTTGEATVKGRHLRRDPRIALCVDDEEPPYAFVLIEGTVELSDDLGPMLEAATRIGGRYMGAERAEEYGRRNAVPGELLVRVTPTRVIAQTNISDFGD